MDRNQYSDAGQRQPRVPPGTPPVVNADANAEDAANVSPDIDDDSDAPGSQPAHFLRGREDELAYGRGNEGHLMSDGGDRDNPGEQPDEIVPAKPKRYGRYSGYTSEWKKAIVKLTADSKPLEFFETV